MSGPPLYITHIRDKGFRCSECIDVFRVFVVVYLVIRNDISLSVIMLDVTRCESAITTVQFHRTTVITTDSNVRTCGSGRHATGPDLVT